MLIEYLNSNNLHKFNDYLDKDASENIGRDFYRGIVVTAMDEPRAGMIWEIVSRHGEDGHKSCRIVWLRMSDPEAGEFLLHYYGKILEADSVERSFFELDESIGETSLKLLKEAGFTLERATGSMAEISLSDIRDIKHTGSPGHKTNIESLEELETTGFKDGIRKCLGNTDREILPDLISLPVTWYEQEVSCYHQTDSGCQGFLLIHRKPSGHLKVELLSDWGSDSKSNMINLIRYSAGQILDLYSEKTRILVYEKNANIRQLVSYLFPQVTRQVCIKGFRKEL